MQSRFQHLWTFDEMFGFLHLEIDKLWEILEEDFDVLEIVGLEEKFRWSNRQKHT